MSTLVSAKFRFLGMAFLLLCSGQATAKEVAASKPMTLTFGGIQYVHRWSQKGQNEFTPLAEPNLEKWNDMVTVILKDDVGNGDQLAALANGVMQKFERGGKILRTDSKPRTPAHPAEHLIVAILGGPGPLETAFARIMLAEGKGVIVVYSHRAYGKDPAAVLGPWLQTKGQSIETTLMAWNGLPKLASIRALPQSKAK